MRRTARHATAHIMTSSNMAIYTSCYNAMTLKADLHTPCPIVGEFQIYSSCCPQHAAQQPYCAVRADIPFFSSHGTCYISGKQNIGFEKVQ